MQRHRILSALLAAVFLAAPEARASHYLVDSGGGGDYGSIQSALNAVQSSPRDTILVTPGNYADVLTWGSGSGPHVVITATGGASVTNVRAVSNGTHSGGTRIVGFTFTDDGDFQGVDYWNCAFLGAVQMTPVSTTTSMHDCDFYGSVRFYSGGYSPTVDHCRFHSAPCTATAGGIGSLILSSCTFEGPGDQLLSGGGDGFDYLAVSNCVFRNAKNGVACSPWTYLSHCLLQGISGDAVSAGGCTTCSGSGLPPFSVTDSRFENCGTAIRHIGTTNPSATFLADTIVGCTGNAIVMVQTENTYNEALIDGVIIESAGGNGIDIALKEVYPAARIKNCRIQNCAGFGLRLADVPGVSWHPRNSYVRNVQVDHCGGPGILVTASNVALTNNVVWANGGHGIALTTQWTDSALSDSVTGNTVVGNAGDGIRMSVIGSLTGVDQVVQRNLVASNQGVGIQMTNPYRGSVAYNDAWSNESGAYAGVASPADSNLVSDPQLCNPSAGDLHLHAGSPAGPSGIYGLIGAKPEGCDALAGVDTPPARLAFSAYPNPARGAVVFAAPVSSAGRVDVVDVLGRRVWTRSLRAGESVRWDGRGENGPIHPGVYLARFSGAGLSRTLRVVWME